MKRDSSKYSSDKGFDITLFLISGYLFLQIMSDLTVGKFIPLGTNLSIPVGSLLYALSFTWIDLINERLGRFRARKTVNVAIVINILMVLWFQFYIRVPGASWWVKDPFPQEAIAYVLGGYWRIIAASITAEFFVEHTDINTFHFFRSKFPTISKWKRSMISNTVSAPLDGFLFATLAFWGTIPLINLGATILGSILYKLIIGYVSAPLIYLIKSKDKKEIIDKSNIQLEEI